MIGVVPLQVPGFAVSVEPCVAVPAMVGSEVLAGGVAVAAEPVDTAMLSATMANAWDAELLPI